MSAKKMSDRKAALQKDPEDHDRLGDVEPGYLLLRLYRAFEPLVDKHLWPWETQRWQELVFCILITVTKREVAPEAIREVTKFLEWAHLLDIDRLGSANPSRNEEDASDAFIVTIATVLQNSGFTADESQAAVATICEAAAGFTKLYGGKVQRYLRHYGDQMLDEIDDSFSFGQLSNADAKQIFSLWLQNVLNMPLPCPDAVTDDACELLKVDYESLVKAADEVNVNVGLLDNVLRSYWERDIELGEEEGQEEEPE